jgi:FtsP/CotA-like multicopper oxidase with cupredoxin domain
METTMKKRQRKRSLPRPTARRVAVALLGAAAFVPVLVAPSPAQPPPYGIVCTDGPSFELETATGRVSTPDGNSVFMWGYRLSGGLFQIPGPVLCVEEGDTVTVELTNDTSAISEPVSIVFPGQAGVTHDDPTPGHLTGEAEPGGGTVTYTFTASRPGTYVYESGTDPSRQVQMGLHGVLIVRPALGDAYAYNDPQTKFSAEYLIVLNEIDPVQHRRVELGQDYDASAYHPLYWTVNGRSFPDVLAANGASWMPNQPYGALVLAQPYDPVANPLPILVRYVNVGVVNHPFHPHGNFLRVIARDGRLLRGASGEDTSFMNFTRTIASGQTYDLLFRWDDVDPWITGGEPVPVQIPGLQDLVFKDDATFYSGDPVLGEQGELPTRVTSFNMCGEYYFPWHSHAVFEFTNFDEGFGGLATVVAVLPPGGC